MTSMPRAGSNLPGFRETQLSFAAHIRNPEAHPAPGDVEPRRMQIYLDLFYNNIESFLASGFPIAKKVLGSDFWHVLVREFVHRHGSESPYFLEISQEFLSFLDQRQDLPPHLPPFLLELCHYEWVELALGVSEVEYPTEGYDSKGDLLGGPVMVSPLIWCLAYRWPVHQIGPGRVPEAAPERGTELIVYRRRDDQVKFMAVNAVTLRLIALLQSGSSGKIALQDLAAEMGEPDSQIVYEQGIATMRRLFDAEILLGSTASD
jgi:hypothetical protein